MLINLGFIYFFDMLFFASKLVVTMVKVNPDGQPGEGTIWFDYFLVKDPRIQSNSSAKSKHVGAIVGGVISGILALIFILLAIFFLRRRHKRQQKHIQPWTDKEVESDGPSRKAFSFFFVLLFTPKTLLFIYLFFFYTLLYKANGIQGVASGHPNIEPFPRGVEENSANPATTPTSTTPRKMASERYPSSASATTTTTHHQSSLSTASSSTSPSSISSPPSNNVITPNTPNRKRQNGGSGGGSGGGSSSAPTSGGPTVQIPSTSLPEPVQHVDSGVRVANTDPVQTPSAPLELPPVYSPV